ncbi:helix-turn-helix transcriptional regulator [Agaribacterium sp. ZY112]|uniref:helix-turn-helix transcriptional regulator n=1 Tax=Agaribacterium sp. ZY112 TaxID=3233574 RepID=UPI003523F36D
MRSGHPVMKNGPSNTASINTSALMQLSAHAGTKVRIHNSQALIENSKQAKPSTIKPEHLAADTALIQGQLQLKHQFGHCLMHSSNTLELENATVSIDREASLTFGVLLQGRLHFAIGKQWHQLPTALNQPEDAWCFAINLMQSCHWQRRLYQGNQVKKVSLSIKQAWLEKKMENDGLISPPLSQLLSQHGSVIYWPASKACYKLASKLTKPRCGSALEKEGLSLQLIAHCLEDISSNSHDLKHLDNPKATDTATLALLRELETWATKAGTELPELETIAKKQGLSISGLHRRFKLNVGKSPICYLRERRLQIARDALIRGEASIGEAAYLAGYKHSSNFCSAFKKTFGLTPGQMLEAASYS